jgi:hypothetical protein
MLFVVNRMQLIGVRVIESEEVKESVKQRISPSNATVEDDPPGTYYSFARRIGFSFQTLSSLVKGI